MQLQVPQQVANAVWWVESVENVYSRLRQQVDDAWLAVDEHPHPRQQLAQRVDFNARHGALSTELPFSAHQGPDLLHLCH
jgi:hypothetical protein